MTSAFKTHIANEDGWSDWDTPVMQGYKMACCDCGLVHDMEFRVLRVIERHDDGSWSAEQVEEDMRIEMRAKRNNRSTGQMRRKHK